MCWCLLVWRWTSDCVELVREVDEDAECFELNLEEMATIVGTVRT